MQCPKPRVHDNITLMMYHAFLPKYKRSEIKTVYPNTKAMDGWMGGWMDGWVSGWMSGWVAGWMDG